MSIIFKREKEKDSFFEAKFGKKPSQGSSVAREVVVVDCTEITQAAVSI